MAVPLDICIRGAGPVGRTLALLLARERLRVGLVAPAPSSEAPVGDVRAYALNAASRELLAQLGAWPDEAHTTAVQGMEIYGDGGASLTFDAASEGVAALAWMVDATALQERLTQALHFQPQIQLLPSAPEATLTVVCEGRASATGQAYGVQWRTWGYAQRAVATRLRSEQPHGGVARQWFDNGNILALLPLGGVQGHELALVWSLREDTAAGVLQLSDVAFEDQLQSATHGVLGRLSLTTARAAWPLQASQADRWCGPGWCLAGDAAHTVHPLAGQGLNLGLADVRVLAEVLHGRAYWRPLGDERLLRRYERARKAELMPMGAGMDGLQRLFAKPGERWSQLRSWGLRGFSHSGPVKHWLARRAMGLSG